MRIGIKKIYPDVQIPKYATKGSACFDIYAYLMPGTTVPYYNGPDNDPDFYVVEKNGIFPLNTGDRALIPTGLILDIPVGYSVRVHIRSSLAFRKGIFLANSEGIIDSDYIDPLFIMLYNVGMECEIEHGQRIAQGELVPIQRVAFETVDYVLQKTDRSGGIGSTGQ